MPPISYVIKVESGQNAVGPHQNHGAVECDNDSCNKHDDAARPGQGCKCKGKRSVSRRGSNGRAQMIACPVPAKHLGLTETFYQVQSEYTLELAILRLMATFSPK